MAVFNASEVAHINAKLGCKLFLGEASVVAFLLDIASQVFKQVVSIHHSNIEEPIPSKQALIGFKWSILALSNGGIMFTRVFWVKVIMAACLGLMLMPLLVWHRGAIQIKQHLASALLVALIIAMASHTAMAFVLQYKPGRVGKLFSGYASSGLQSLITFALMLAIVLAAYCFYLLLYNPYFKVLH